MDKSNDKGLHTILGEGTYFEGTLTVPHSVRIDGQLKGKLETSETLTVGSKGHVDADIVAKNAIIGGKIRGNMSVEDRVELETTASLIGDLKTRDLVINEGAVFQGNCQMDIGKNIIV